MFSLNTRLIKKNIAFSKKKKKEKIFFWTGKMILVVIKRRLFKINKHWSIVLACLNVYRQYVLLRKREESIPVNKANHDLH